MDVDGFPRSVQRPHPPLLVAGGGRRILSFAAREADIVGLMVRSKPDGSGLDAADATAESMDQKVRWVRDAAGDRVADIEFNVLIQHVQRSPHSVTERTSNPYEVFGDVDDICTTLVERRELYGVSYVVIFEKDLDAFAHVVSRLSGT